MKGEWCYFRNYFSPEYCNQLIENASVLPAQEAVTGLNNSQPDYRIRRSHVKFINRQHVAFQGLFDELWKLALQANNDWFNIHITRLDFVQLAEYNSAHEGEYKAHHDVFWVNKDPIYHRKLSCVVQLTDPLQYQGGDFEMIDVGEFPNREDLRSQGTVIFFPSFFTHRANKVTAGIRHSIAAWFEGPKWR